MGSRGAGMFTGYVMESIPAPSAHQFSSLRVWVSCTSTCLPRTTPGNRLEVSSSPPGYLFSLHLNPSCPPWAGKVLRIAWWTSFQKDSVFLRAAKYFSITHTLSSRSGLFFFSSLLKKSTHKWCLRVNTELRCSLSNIYQSSTGWEARYYPGPRGTATAGQCRGHTLEPWASCSQTARPLLPSLPTPGPTFLYLACPLSHLARSVARIQLLSWNSLLQIYHSWGNQTAKMVRILSLNLMKSILGENPSGVPPISQTCDTW